MQHRQADRACHRAHNERTNRSADTGRLPVVGDCLLERRADDGARDSKKRFAKNLDEKLKQEFDKAPIGERLTSALTGLPRVSETIVVPIPC